MLLLGMRVATQLALTRPLSELIQEPKIAASEDRRRAVTLENRRITLYDTTSSEARAISQRSINDLKTAVGGGPWFKCAPTSVHELALSSSGNLLAIALDRTIQIYDLTAGEDAWPVSSYISSAAGHYIAGLQFQHNDSLLRVQLSNKGAVLYLGTPQDSVQGLQHWLGKGGLKHAFLDSSKAVLRPLSHTGVSGSLAGLQLLRPFENGWLVAAQKRCATSRSHDYCIGHVAISELDQHVATAQKLISILVTLSCSVDFTPMPETVHDIWQGLPSGFLHHLQFSMSQDNSLLAVSEDASVPAHTGISSRVFVYRLPDIRRMASQLNLIRPAALADTKQEPAACGNPDDDAIVIQRLPLSVGGIDGKVLLFGFDQHLSNRPVSYSWRLSATTETCTKMWSLTDV